jgi:hypothetical protein
MSAGISEYSIDHQHFTIKRGRSICHYRLPQILIVIYAINLGRFLIVLII